MRFQNLDLSYLHRYQKMGKQKIFLEEDFQMLHYLYQVYWVGTEVFPIFCIRICFVERKFVVFFDK